ncbi:MAG: hypothetical protein PHH11_04200 [Methylomonas sp.]|nr:hypothetical protein [Methylomonas sp.]
MKTRNAWNSVLLLTTLIFAQAATAVTPAEEAEKKCIKPKFRDFTPAHNSEVAPESTISFHINRNVDPLHVSASARKIPMAVEVVDKKTFYYVSAKLPKELTEGFARIHIEAKAAEGNCIGQDGWLIILKDGASADKTETAE